MFFGCISVKNITIPDGVTEIQSSAFSYCQALTSITIPNSVTNIGSCAFMDSPKVTIYCDADKQPAKCDLTCNLDNRHVVWGYTGDK